MSQTELNDILGALEPGLMDESDITNESSSESLATEDLEVEEIGLGTLVEKNSQRDPLTPESNNEEYSDHPASPRNVGISPSLFEGLSPEDDVDGRKHVPKLVETFESISAAKDSDGLSRPSLHQPQTNLAQTFEDLDLIAVGTPSSSALTAAFDQLDLLVEGPEPSPTHVSEPGVDGKEMVVGMIEGTGEYSPGEVYPDEEQKTKTRRESLRRPSGVTPPKMKCDERGQWAPDPRPDCSHITAPKVLAREKTSRKDDNFTFHNIGPHRKESAVFLRGLRNYSEGNRSSLILDAATVPFSRAMNVTDPGCRLPMRGSLARALQGTGNSPAGQRLSGPSPTKAASKAEQSKSTKTQAGAHSVSKEAEPTAHGAEPNALLQLLEKLTPDVDERTKGDIEPQGSTRRSPNPGSSLATEMENSPFKEEASAQAYREVAQLSIEMEQIVFGYAKRNGEEIEVISPTCAAPKSLSTNAATPPRAALTPPGATKRPTKPSNAHGDPKSKPISGYHAISQAKRCGSPKNQVTPPSRKKKEKRGLPAATAGTWDSSQPDREIYRQKIAWQNVAIRLSVACKASMKTWLRSDEANLKLKRGVTQRSKAIRDLLKECEQKEVERVYLARKVQKMGDVTKMLSDLVMTQREQLLRCLQEILVQQPQDMKGHASGVGTLLNSVNANYNEMASAQFKEMQQVMDQLKGMMEKHSQSMTSHSDSSGKMIQNIQRNYEAMSETQHSRLKQMAKRIEKETDITKHMNRVARFLRKKLSGKSVVDVKKFSKVKVQFSSNNGCIYEAALVNFFKTIEKHLDIADAVSKVSGRCYELY
eukprot:gene12136-14341_t